MSHLKTDCLVSNFDCYDMRYTKHVDFSKQEEADVQNLNDTVGSFKTVISRINELKDDLSTSELMVSSTQTLYAICKSYKIVLILIIFLILILLLNKFL